MNRYDGEGYPDVCEYALTLNAHMQIFKKVNPRLYVDCGPKPVINVGHKYDGSQASNDFSGRIACLMISKRKYVSLTDVFKYYRFTKDYIVDNQLVDVDAQTVDFRWHTIGLSFNHPSTSNSQNNKYFDLRVFVDDNIWNVTRITTFEYSQLTFSMGRKFNGVSTISNFGNYSNLYPLYGQIEMLATRAAYCEFLTLKELKDELVDLTKVNEFDEFGMLKKTEVHQAGRTILSNTYAYKTRSDSKYLSKQVSSETIKVGNQSFTRDYITDALGNLTSISDSTFGNHSYEYDYRGFLTTADGEKYEYDGNGNITRKGSINFVYDNAIKDRLVSVNGVAISYDSSNPLNPTKYGSKGFNFEGRRLTRFSLTDEDYDYKYNDQGLRIQKKNNHMTTWDYTYDGDKLIYESSPYGKLNFLYDENNMLYGFIKDNTEKYLYIRDNLQNIIAITTLSGEIVVKYTYDAWGKLLSTTGSLAFDIGALNPFKYKGYYYDQESGMYYCKSRYYVPDWCRWLNADNPENIKICSVVDTNLFVYCNNQPLIYSDENGNIPKWLKKTLIAAAIVVGTVAFVAAIVASAGTVGALAGTAAATIGMSSTAVATTVSIATTATYVVATGVAIFSASDLVEVVTETCNPIRDWVMGGNQEVYDITHSIFDVLGSVAVVAGSFGPKILQNIAKKGGNPVISKGKTVGYKIDFFDKNGKWSARIDATTHGNPKLHHNPHFHYLERDVKQGGISKAVKYFWEIIKSWF